MRGFDPALRAARQGTSPVAEADFAAHPLKPIPEQQPWDLDALSDIRCTYFLSPMSRNPRRRILTVRYEGLYRIGCLGQPDSTYMEVMTVAAITATMPDGLIFDFTNLDYKWGDNLDQLYGVATNHPYSGADLPWAVVLGEHCREAVISLECGELALQEPAEWMFDTFAEAWYYVDDRIRA
jgi:hypothetical protein